MQSYVDGLLNDNTYKLWETRNNNNESGTYTGYSNDAFPKSVAYYHGINYYDDYNFYNNAFGFPVLPQVGNARVKTLLTGMRTTVLGTGTMLLDVNYYDAEGRVITSKSENHIGGSDVVNNEWNFDGSLKNSTRTHVGNGATTTIVNRYAYDQVGRKKTTRSQINGGQEVTLSSLTYNEIGQLIDKGQHSTDGVNFAQHTGYAYNERGWLTGQSSGLFYLSLGYNSGSSPQYNGNISSQTYTNGGASNTFNYTYDRLNRLTVSTAGNSLGESLSYDVMGNIKSLYREGGYGTNDYHIDLYKGNQLKTISGFTNGNYTYNENGNLTIDGPNGNNISYNYLNLPIGVSGNQSVDYTYDATGKKLRKVSATGGTTNYLDGIVYKTDGTIDFIQTEEGIARSSSGSYSYEYNLTDHLGNVRTSFQKNPVSGSVDPIQRDDYYAFGLRKVASGGANKYLYNGKELQEELGQYDYGARFYDPVIGRWNVVDPASELMRRYSPYNYSFNNPVRFTDPDGMVPGDFLDENGKKIGNDGIDDGKVYLIKTSQKKFDSGAPSAGISKSDRKVTESFIEKNSGNTTAFEQNDIAYRNSVEIEGKTSTRQSMVDIVNQDNGRGGISDANNREYGGAVKSDGSGAVEQSTPGPVANPITDRNAHIDLPNYTTRSTFHSHPSGTKFVTSTPNNNFTGASSSVGGSTSSGNFLNAPSNIGGDVGNSGGKINYVFSRSNGTVYVYNNTGVIATMPQKYFVTPNQKK